MKLTPSVNFTNILCVRFFVQKPFFLLRFGKEALSYEKCAHKTLMKLTPSVNFTNILWTVFSWEKCKKTVKSSVPFCAFSSCVKAAHKMLLKLTPVVCFINTSGAAFGPIFFGQKMSKPNSKYSIAAQSIFVQKRCS